MSFQFSTYLNVVSKDPGTASKSVMFGCQVKFEWIDSKDVNKQTEVRTIEMSGSCFMCEYMILYFQCHYTDTDVSYVYLFICGALGLVSDKPNQNACLMTWP